MKNNEIGKRIMARRKQLGLTQEQASEISSLSTQFFSSVETGRKNISAESVIKLSKALGVSTDYILTGATNEVDTSNISKLINTLDGYELLCLEDIIKAYIKAVKNNQS